LFRYTVILILVIGLASISLLSTGCGSRGSNDIEVVLESTQDQAKSKDGLDPLTRGKIRRQILDDTEEIVAFWLKGDMRSLEQGFTKELFTKYESRVADLHNEGQEKIRIHENQDFEVTELSKNAATVKYIFDDKSYFISKSTGKKVKALDKPKTEIDISVEKSGKRWKVKAMFGSSDGTL